MNATISIFFRCLPALGLAVLLLAGCGAESPEKKIARLEQQFREGTTGGSVSLSSGELRSLMEELAGAYVAYADGHAGDFKSAEYLYRAGEIKETNLMNPQGALEIYQRIRTEYPQSERAADALFKQGFIYNNNPQVKDLARAEAAYKEFIAQFPDHHLRNDAEKELEFLGLSDEEVLKRLLESGGAPAEPADTAAQADPS